MKIAFHTLGCKVNQYDTQSMMRLFKDAGHEIVDFEETADCYIINTCTVTAVSDKKSRQMISRAHSRNQRALICVAGCFAQRDSDAALALPGVRLAIGNQGRSDIVKHVEALYDRESETINAVSALESGSDFEELPALCEGKTRATLKIQEGCNRFCSYCIIPTARGPLRSRDPDNIISEAKRLSELGFCELVLSGIHLASYKSKNGETLIDVLEALSTISGLKRVRLGSLDPAILTDEFCKRISNIDNVCDHFHVSMQSGSDTVLARMNRRYDSSEYAEKIENLRNYMPEAAITTDIIAGFPGETDDEYAQTFRFVERIAFSRIHVFPFSPRIGTPAANMTGQVPKDIKDARTRELIALGKKLEYAYIDRFIGREMTVLIEGNDRNGLPGGYTSSYIYVSLSGCKSADFGDLKNTKLISRVGGSVEGIVL